MANCIVVVQFDLPKRTEEMAIKGGSFDRADLSRSRQERVDPQGLPQW